MRRLIGALVCFGLIGLSTACASIPASPASERTSPDAGSPAPSSAASPAAPSAGPASGGAAGGPAPTSTAPAPGPAPAAAAHGAVATAPAATQDAIVWVPGGIGYPLRSDDPRAQGKKVVMLTFDDGPSAEATAQVLDILKAEHIRALFFVTGYGAKHEDLLRRIDQEGHVIGTHTMTHPNLTTLDREGQRREIVPVNEIVERVTGKRPKYFRPPHGAYDDTLQGLLKELGMDLINWSAGSLDWELTDPDRIVRQVLDTVHPGAIVLFHDTHKHTVEALPKVIRGLRDRGYEFVVLR